MRVRRRGARAVLGLGAAAFVAGICWLAIGTSHRRLSSEHSAALTFAAVESPSPDPARVPSSSRASRAEEQRSVDPAQEPQHRRNRPFACSGRVLELDGSPIAGAELELRTLARNGPSYASAASDGEGRFRFDALVGPRARLNVVARAPGHLRVERAIDEARAELVLRLPPAVELHGRVLDADTGRPIAGASLWNASEERAVSAADGGYRLSGFAIDRRETLHVRCDGYFERELELRVAKEGARELVVELRAGARFTVRVVDAANDSPLAGIDVARHRGQSPFARTDASGGFDLLVAGGVESTAWMAAEGYSPVSWSWEPASLAGCELAGEHRLPMRRCVWIDGRVVDEDGAPIGGCSVSSERTDSPPVLLSDEEREGCGLPGRVVYGEGRGEGAVRTDERGDYRISCNAASGALVLAFHHPDFVPQRSRPVGLEQPGSSARIDAVLELGATLRGRVRCNGEPVEAFVQCEQGDAYSDFARTDDEGRYEFLHAQTGALDVTVHATPGPRVDREARVELERGEARELDFVWEEERLPIRGRVLDSEGTPLPNVRVRAWRSESGSELSEWSTGTAPDGRFVLLVAPGAPYTVGAGRGVVGCVRAGVPPGSEGAELMLAGEGRIVLQLVDSATRKAARVSGFDAGSLRWRPEGEGEFRTLSNWSASTMDLNGRVEFPFPAGRFDLRFAFQRDGYRATERRGVEVVANSATEPLVVELERGIELELRFVASASGAPQGPPATLLFLLAEDERDAVRGPFVEREGEANCHVGGVNLWLADGVLLDRMLRVDERGVAVVRGLAPGRYLLRSLPQALDFEPAVLELGDEPRAVRELRWSAR